MLALEAGWLQEGRIDELLAFHSSQGRRCDSLLASAFGPAGTNFELFFVEGAKKEDRVNKIVESKCTGGGKRQNVAQKMELQSVSAGMLAMGEQVLAKFSI